MAGLTDMHSHFLYGLDDGAKTRRGMERMLDAAYAGGIRCLFATPHVTPGVQPYSMEDIEARVKEARQYCRQKDYPIRIFCGAEILYTRAIERFASERALPTLADTNRVLVEFGPEVSLADLESALDLFDRFGYEVILAHIERYKCMQRGVAYKIKAKYDVKFQMNCGSIVGSRTFFERIWIQKWLRDGLIDFFGSDAHNVTTRPFRMESAYQELKKLLGEERADLLCGRAEDAYKRILYE